jgi:hypothetical protein
LLLKPCQVSITENVYCKELGILVAVWLIILALQIGKVFSATPPFHFMTASLFFFSPSVVINKANGKPTPVYLSQNYSTTCSVEYWLLNTMQVPYLQASLYMLRNMHNFLYIFIKTPFLSVIIDGVIVVNYYILLLLYRSRWQSV